MTTLDAGAKAPGEWLAGFFCGPRFGPGNADAQSSHFGFSDAVSLIQREPCYSERELIEPSHNQLALVSAVHTGVPVGAGASSRLVVLTSCLGRDLLE